MNIEHFESREEHPVIAEVTAPREDPDHSGESLLKEGEGVEEVILRIWGADVSDPAAVAEAMRKEKNTQRKAQLSNLFRAWQEEMEGKRIGGEA